MEFIAPLTTLTSLPGESPKSDATTEAEAGNGAIFCETVACESLPTDAVIPGQAGDPAIPVADPEGPPRTESDDDDPASESPDDPVEVLLDGWCGVTGRVTSSFPKPVAPDSPRGEHVVLRAKSGPAAGILTDQPAPVASPLTDTESAPEYIAPDQAGDSPPQPRPADRPLPETSGKIPVPHTAPRDAPPESAPRIPLPDAAPRQTVFQVQPTMRQIVDAVVTSHDDRVEITLSPEELGRVRMVLSGHDRAPHLSIWVERPETLDQMRRHGHHLQQQLQEEGMPDATLDFHGGQQRHGRDQPERFAEILRPDPAGTAFGPLHIPARIAPTPPPLSGSRRLDIRI
ncbi:flagellar hook-length control protein FliK [Paracoccus sp. (in: a-proteobacteria)]|uniref:flagellar hook-length control protein FliK n=1 Tax=Paracoccus sp. TaxID=267 RepID=UPI003A886C49